MNTILSQLVHDARPRLLVLLFWCHKNDYSTSCSSWVMAFKNWK